MDIHSLAGLSTLLGDVATGRHLASVELVGAETIKGESIKVYDVKLSEVLVSSFENDPRSAILKFESYQAALSSL